MSPVSKNALPFGTVGVWRGYGLFSSGLAAAVEELGYGALWVGGSPDADLAIVERLLSETKRITVSTGIVNIWTAPADEVAESFHRLEARYPQRFVLGIGIGHREQIGERHVKPFDALQRYLDSLDAAGVPAERRVISALGPRTLKLAAERSAGTHPYLTTPTHTLFARSVLGAGPLVAPEQRFVPVQDPQQARATGRAFLARYLALTNYRRTMEKHGFTAAELDDGATDQAVDRLTPHGAAADLATHVQAHHEAGADHVCVQMLPMKMDPLPALTQLATALGLGTS